MNTDHRALVELLERFGFTPEFEGTNIIFRANSNNRITGHQGFLVEFNFDAEERFMYIGIWE